MGLQHGILGFLNYGPCSGYELAKAFHSSVQFFWPAQTSQIYLTLGKLEHAGLVAHETVIQNGKPNKNVYSILPAGREELLRFVWGNRAAAGGDVRTVDVHVRRLREKIEPSPSDPKYVHTKWGVGYYFRIR